MTRSSGFSRLEFRTDQANTAVLATADHGDMLGDSDMLYKGSFLEGAIRVPFIYRPPAENRTGTDPIQATVTTHRPTA